MNARPYVTTEEVLRAVAEGFAASGNRRPSHCDVRCAVNDHREALRRDGYRMAEHYSQDRAHRRVRRIIGEL